MRSLIKKGPMMRRGYLFLALAFAARLLISQPLQAEGELKTEYVVLVTIDGLRNEELFGGADPKLLNNSKRSGAAVVSWGLDVSVVLRAGIDRASRAQFAPTCCRRVSSDVPGG